MKKPRWMFSIIFAAVLVAVAAPEPQGVKLGQNAALRYWSAFAQMQDSPLTDLQVKELSAILKGTTPYDDAKFKDLVEENKPALETMARGTALANCDWGLDYELGPETPIDYVGRATALARLNVFYAFHLVGAGDKEGAVQALVAGLRFSRNIADGGPLIATLLAKDSLAKHLDAVAFVVRTQAISSQQRQALAKALVELGVDPLDWQSTINLEMAALKVLPWPSSASAERVTQAYLNALGDPSGLPKLQGLIASLPKLIQGSIPNLGRVLKERQDLKEKLRETRSLLQ
jgi:hypothetical protein